jgi:pyruvate dehydrogenase E2 component (dihydrolipoamide acetyltransferase)
MSGTELVMPRLSDTMEEGTILRWLKADGDTVARGEELVEIETDKATMVYESDLAGTLQIVAGEGQTLPVGELIAHVGDIAASPAAAGGDEDERRAAPGGTASEPARTAPGAEAANGTAVVGGEGSNAAAAGGQGPGSGAGSNADGEAPGRGAGPEDAPERLRASPLARRLARERGVELADVHGSGPHGRIVRADVEQAPPGTPAPAPAAVAAAVAPVTGPPSPSPDATGTPAAAGVGDVTRAKGETTVVALSRTQQAIARRMAESRATVPDFSVQVDVDMQQCVALRTQLKSLAHPADAGEAGDHEVPTYNDMVVKACALALREHPRVNGSYRDGAVQLHSRVNVGVAVAAEHGDTHAGTSEHSHTLVVPTVFDADTKALGEIARETRRLAQRVREQTITPPELGGGTFTVSNLGMLGVRSFTAIINPPQAAILSVGALEQRVVVDEEGSFAARPMLALTLVSDHRILYGADAARFAARVRELLQAPAALTL